jgi:hypothetical protein
MATEDEDNEVVSRFAMHIALLYYQLTEGTPMVSIKTAITPMIGLAKQVLVNDLDNSSIVKIDQPIPDDYAALLGEHVTIPDDLRGI